MLKKSNSKNSRSNQCFDWSQNLIELMELRRPQNLNHGKV